MICVALVLLIVREKHIGEQTRQGEPDRFNFPKCRAMYRTHSLFNVRPTMTVTASGFRAVPQSLRKRGT